MYFGRNYNKSMFQNHLRGLASVSAISMPIDSPKHQPVAWQYIKLICDYWIYNSRKSIFRKSLKSTFLVCLRRVTSFSSVTMSIDTTDRPRGFTVCPIITIQLNGSYSLDPFKAFGYVFGGTLANRLVKMPTGGLAVNLIVRIHYLRRSL